MKTTEPKTTTQNLQSEEARQPVFREEGQGVFFSEVQTKGISGSATVQPFFDPGNGSGTPFFTSLPVQAKLTVGRSGDKYEQEAEAVAGQVVRELSGPAGNKGERVAAAEGKPAQRSAANERRNLQMEGEEKLEEEKKGKEKPVRRKPIFESGGEPEENGVQRKCAKCALEKKEKEGVIAPKVQPKLSIGSAAQGTVQKKCAACEEESIQPKRIPSSGGGAQASPDLASRLKRNKGGGSPLPADTRSSMESAFGADFAGVRVHTGDEAIQMNRELGAQAFTHGSDIYFNRGKYDPISSGGKHLLAHELAHTVQQGGSSIQPKQEKSDAGVPNIQTGLGDWLEEQAGGVADWVGETASGAVDWAGERIEDVVEMGAEFFMEIIERIAPELAELIRKGPKAMLASTIGESIEGLLQGLLGGLDLSAIAGDVRGGLAEAFQTIQGVLSGDPKSCEAFANGIEAIRNLIQQFTDNPVIQALKTAFDTIAGFVKKLSSLILTPVFEALKEIGGGIFEGIKAMAGQIWEWGKAIKDFLGEAWDWVMEQLGISTDGEGGVWEWIKGIASDIWNEIKETFGPIIEPVKNVLKVLVALSPAGPFIIAVKYGPQIVESVKWLWANKDNPDIVKAAHEEMGHTILPQLLSSVQGFFQGFQSGVNEFVNTLTQLGTHLLELIGGITGVPILSFLQNLVQSISSGVQNLITWGQETLMKAVEWVKQKYHDFKQYIDPLVEVLSSLAMALVNPGMIPIILAGWAWRALPDCYKPPIIDFLLDAIIGILEAIPALPTFGLLWPLIKNAMIGLLRGFRARSDEDKIKVTDKLAKIASGASLSFIYGFVKGFLRGVWEGSTDPGVLMFMAIDGLNKLMSWFNSLIFEGEAGETEETATAATAGGSTQTAAAAPGAGAAGGPPPGLVERMHEMGAELEPPVTEVTGNFRPAVTEYFQGGEGMTFDQLVAKMGEMWSLMEAKIQEGAAQLADKIVEFLLKDSAEEEMGDGIGWLSGTIVFEVILAYFTAGSYTAAKGAMKVLKFFAKILDWTGEVLGAAFKLLSKLGGFVIDIVKGLGKLLSNAGGPIKAVIDALKEIGEKLVRFGEELFGKFAKEAGGEAAEKTAKEVVGEGTEKVGKEVVEGGAEKTGKEAAGEVGEKGAKEATEETGEKGIKETAEETAEEAAERGGKVAGTESFEDGTKLTFYEDGRFFICWNPCGKVKDRFGHMLNDDILRQLDSIDLMLKTPGQKLEGRRAAKKLYQELYEKESRVVWDMQLRLGSLSDEEAGILDELLSIRKQDLIPSNKSKGVNEFEKWFDEISDEEFELLWKDSEIREMIESRIRWPGEEHEWLLASRADYFKRWGVSMEDIHKWRTPTSSTGGINPFWKHGEGGSTTAHNELINIIENAVDFDDFKRQLNNWANYRLVNGVDDLPKGLRLSS